MVRETSILARRMKCFHGNGQFLQNTTQNTKTTQA